MSKLDVDTSRLPKIADLLLAIHQCEHRSYRYMAHVMQAAQQACKMKLAITRALDTMYMTSNKNSLQSEFEREVTPTTVKKGMMW